MKVYFDKDNYINYLKSFNDTELGRDTMRMVKKQLSVHLNFNIETLDDYEKVLLGEFQSGVDAEFTFTHSSDQISRPITKESFPSDNGIYLLNDEGVDKIKSYHSFLVSSMGNEIECLSRLIINEDYSFHLEKIIGDDITPANMLDILNLPFSTLVIIDRYMFKGPEVGGNLGLYDYNLDKILKKIYQDKNSASRLIFVYQVKVNVPQGNPLYDEGPDLDKLYRKLKNVVPKNCKTPEIFLIGVPSGFIDDEHDRFIISNYIRVKSGDTFVYFNSKGDQVTSSKTIDFYSIAFRSYRLTNKAILEKISAVIANALGSHPKFSKVPDGIKIGEIVNF